MSLRMELALDRAPKWDMFCLATFLSILSSEGSFSLAAASFPNSELAHFLIAASTSGAALGGTLTLFWLQVWAASISV
jgi:hypothetical protein